jgi:hypothetical protein
MTIRRRWTALTLALVVGAAIPASAQVGLRAGLALATLHEAGAEPQEWKTQIGFAAGVSFRLPLLPPVVSLQPELLFVEKGAKVVSTGAGNTIGYLDVSPLLRLAVPTPGFTPYVVGGPVGSLRANCSGTLIRCDRLYRAFDAGVVAGAGVRVRNLSFEGRWTAGLTNINAGDGPHDTRTRTVLILVGLSP